MNQKVPFHELSARIAKATGISEESAELFVKNFFEILSEALVNEENVKIKGIGSFTISGSGNDRTIDFVPDKEITDVINAPFSMFDPVILNDSVSDRMLEEIDKEELIKQPEAEVTTSVNGQDFAEESVNDSEASIESVVIETIVNEKPATSDSEITIDNAVKKDVPKESISVSQISTKDDNETEPKPASSMPDNEKKSSVKLPVYVFDDEPEERVATDSSSGNSANGGNFWTGLIIGIVVGAALGACGVYLAIDHFFPTIQHSEVTITEDEGLVSVLEGLIPEETDSVKVASSVEETTETEAAIAPTATVQEPVKADPVSAAKSAVVTDTVRRGYLLVNMAKKYFGSKDYWGYIYEENKAKIPNPNNVPAGLVVIIPPAEKYGIVPGDAESQRKAQAKVTEILKKYPR